MDQLAIIYYVDEMFHPFGQCFIGIICICPVIQSAWLTGTIRNGKMSKNGLLPV